MIITVAASAKYIYIVCTRDWTSLEDWISISYLLFYLAVFLIIFSLLKEVKTNSSQGYVHDLAIQANTTVVTNKLRLQIVSPLDKSLIKINKRKIRYQCSGSKYLLIK